MEENAKHQVPEAKNRLLLLKITGPLLKKGVVLYKVTTGRGT